MRDQQVQPNAILRRGLNLLLVTGILLPALMLDAQETNAAAKAVRWGNFYLRQKSEWYATAEARRIAENLLQHQSPVGGWPKSVDFAAAPTPQSLADAVSGGRANSLDNDATTLPMRFLALAAQATRGERYRQSFARGLDYLFAAQYPNGGWPQFFPLREGYYSHITYNDGAMMNVMTLLRNVSNGKSPYEFVDADRRAKAAVAVARGIDCILRTQITQDGKLTAWCAQHDEHTLAPAWARNYEVPSLSGEESVEIVRFLMQIEQPTPEIIAAVQGAVAWLKSVTITGLRYERGMRADGKRDGSVKPDPTAGPLWARFYELGSNRPIFTGRDKIVRYSLSEIERERRGGYAFYGDWAESLLTRDYPRWLAKHQITPASEATSESVSESKLTSKPRVIVTSDGEIDDECSMVRFLLYANEWDIEGIITSSSQYHAHGHKWAGDDWVQPYLEAYAKVHPNLIRHDPGYPTPEFLQSRTFLGNVEAEGEMDKITPGSQRIVEVLLDDSDARPIWIQAWGGPNTIARALKTIEDDHPEKMAEVAKKIRFYFIWEQDNTYQSYIRPHWGKYGIPTIISDQFIAIFYHWKKYLPADKQPYLIGSWMKSHILENHGPLCALYRAHGKGEGGFEEGDFRSEGDSPAFLHTIPTGLRNMESPGWGGWGGRFTRVRDNTWLDPVAEPGYEYPEGRWYTSSAWGRTRLKREIPNDAELIAYLKPQWRWIDAFQNDFAARADWCVKPYDEANHPPVVKLANTLDLTVRPGDTVSLSAEGTTDPDGDTLIYRWWEYQEADSYPGSVPIENAEKRNASMTVPTDATAGQTIHIICEVTDTGAPPLTRYQRILCKIEQP